MSYHIVTASMYFCLPIHSIIPHVHFSMITHLAPYPHVLSPLLARSWGGTLLVSTTSGQMSGLSIKAALLVLLEKKRPGEEARLSMHPAHAQTMQGHLYFLATQEGLNI